MKKIITIVIAVLLMLSVTACGQPPYDRVHIDSYSYSGCYTVKGWNEEAGRIEIDTKEEGVIILDEENPGSYCFLERGEECQYCKDENEVCPYCGRED